MTQAWLTSGKSPDKSKFRPLGWGGTLVHLISTFWAMDLEGQAATAGARTSGSWSSRTTTRRGGCSSPCFGSFFGVFAHGARNGQEALQSLFAVHPHLILCDLQMPHLDGFGFVRHLRGDPKFGRILTIAVTGLAHPVDVAAAREAGFDGHVMKPLTATTLARLLDRAWDTREAGDSPEDVA